MPLYWGEIHIHTAYSDGIGSPSENLSHARDSVDLDFASITDHAEDLDDNKWNSTKESIERYNSPGEFVTLLGFEWTHPSGKEVWKPLIQEGLPPSKLDTSRYGHRNVYYKELGGRYYSWKDPNTNDPEKLYDVVKMQNAQALAIPHHPASYVFPMNWDYHNPEFERLVEIYSIWGSSELSGEEGNDRPILRGGGEVTTDHSGHVKKALNRGCKVGIIAGSDGHDGRGGRTKHHIKNETEHPGPFYPSGITGIFAEELTREAVWDALWNRRAYGTTGSKIALEFNLNGHKMGSLIKSQIGPELTAEINIEGTADIQKVEIVGEKSVVENYTGNCPRFSIETKLPYSGNGTGKYYYVRVTQTDQEMAWSSPIWIE